MSKEQQQIADNQKGGTEAELVECGQIGINDGGHGIGPKSVVGDQQALTMMSELNKSNDGVGQANGGDVEKPMEVGDEEGPKDEEDKNGGGGVGQQQKAATPGDELAQAKEDERAPTLIAETTKSSSSAGTTECDGSRKRAPSGNNGQQQKRRQPSGSSSGSKVAGSNNSQQHVQAVQQQPPQQLRIQRVFRNEEGVEIQQTETITDPRLIENYLKMRMMCQRDQLWQYALGGEEDEKDHRALLRRLQKRFQYHAKKQKQQQKKLARVGEGRKVLAKKASMSIRIQKQPAKKKRTFSIPLGGPTTTAAEQGPSPSSSGYSTTSGGGEKPEPEDQGNPETEMSEKQKDKKNTGNGVPEEVEKPEEPEEDEKSETPEGMNRGGRRSVARRSNAGVKRRYSPGAELLRPQMAAGHRRKLTGEAVAVVGVMLPAGQ